jgi:surface polysaccharide O-acyltransferase-like enzyme
LAVVFIHVAATALQRVRSGSLDWWAANIYHAATVWAVPGFVLISGALLLDPRRTYTTRGFLDRRASRILVPLVFWSAVYLAVRLYRGQTDAVQAAVDLLFGQPSAHLWYLYMAAGLYLVTPPLRTFVAAARPAELRYATALALAVGMAVNLTGYFLGLPSPLAFVLFVPFVGYYLLGQTLHRPAGEGDDRPAPRFKTGWFLIAAAGASAVTAAGTGLIRQSSPDFTGWKILCDQLSPTVMVAAVAVFMLAPAIERGSGLAVSRLKRAGGWAAPYALGVYIIHPLVMQALEEWVGLSAETWGAAAGVPVMSLIVFAVSLGLCRAIALAPGARLTIGIK